MPAIAGQQRRDRRREHGGGDAAEADQQQCVVDAQVVGGKRRCIAAGAEDEALAERYDAAAHQQHDAERHDAVRDGHGAEEQQPFRHHEAGDEQRRHQGRCRTGWSCAGSIRSSCAWTRWNRPSGPEHQHDGHCDVDAEQFRRRPGMHRQRPRQSDDQRTDGGAFDTAQPADDDHGERHDDHSHRQPRLHRDHRRGECAGQGGEEHAEHEGEGVDSRDVDAHARGDLLAMHDREHDLAGAGAVQAPPDRESAGGRHERSARSRSRHSSSCPARRCRTACTARRRTRASRPRSSLVTSSRIRKSA